MHIKYLADCPDFLPLTAKWLFEGFGHLDPAGSIESFAESLNERLGRKCIPTTFIAISGSKLLGTASLVESDMDIRPELSPWLAAVFVTPDYRRQGIGSRLVIRVEEEAKVLGVKRLHLYTPDMEHFYAHLGWATVESTYYRGYHVAIMARDLAM